MIVVDLNVNGQGTTVCIKYVQMFCAKFNVLRKLGKFALSFFGVMCSFSYQKVVYLGSASGP